MTKSNSNGNDNNNNDSKTNFNNYGHSVNSNKIMPILWAVVRRFSFFIGKLQNTCLSQNDM